MFIYGLILCNSSPGRRARRVFEQEIADGEIIQTAVEKSANRIPGAAHDGLFVHVEAGVDHAGQAGDLPVLIHDPVVAWIRLPVYELRPRSSIHVDHRGAALLHPGCAVEGDRHEL